MRGSSYLIAVINLLTMLSSLPVLGGGIWLSTKTNNSECLKFLQWPLIIIGLIIFVISVTGLTGSCFRNTLLMFIYLVVLFFIIVVLFSFIIFAYVVTDKGSGKEVQNRAYLEYHLQDYSGWLKERVVSDNYWTKIKSCVKDNSMVCSKLQREEPETADKFYLRKLSPIQSGCCKPPTECGYVYQNETVWSPGEGVVGTNPDCTRWSNDQQMLCYECDSCKAGVLASLKKSWRKVSGINIGVSVTLVIVHPIAYGAYKNNLKLNGCDPCGRTKMSKILPK